MRFSFALFLLCRWPYFDPGTTLCCQFGFMPGHPGTPDLFVGFLDGCGGFSEAMQQDSGAVFIEKVQDAIASLAHPQPGFSEFAFDLRGVWKIQRRPTYFEQIDPSQDLASNFFGYRVEPVANGKCPILVGIKVDLP